MKNLAKLLSILLALAMLVGIIAGCANQSDETTEEGSENRSYKTGGGYEFDRPGFNSEVFLKKWNGSGDDSSVKSEQKATGCCDYGHHYYE